MVAVCMTVCCVLFVYAINIDIAVLLHFCSPKDRQGLINALASGGLRPPDPLPGLRPWNPLGDCPPDPLPLWTPQTKNSSAAPAVLLGGSRKLHISAKECHRAINRNEGSCQLSHAYDRFLDATADRRIKTQKS